MNTPTAPSATAGLATGLWQLDPARQRVEFHVPNFYGLMTVTGRFERYEGTLNVSGRPAVAPGIEADTLKTHNKRRDTHLRSDDFFDVANPPRLRFEADDADLDGDTLKVRGLLYAAGNHVPLEVEATVTAVGAEFEIEAIALVDK